MSNAELFSTVAREYANFRPGYPPALFAWLARISPSREAVWDCGCGSGQASVALAEHFREVYATDVEQSAEPGGPQHDARCLEEDCILTIQGPSVLERAATYTSQWSAN